MKLLNTLVFLDKQYAPLPGIGKQFYYLKIQKESYQGAAEKNKRNDCFKNKNLT